MRLVKQTVFEIPIERIELKEQNPNPLYTLKTYSCDVTQM